MKPYAYLIGISLTAAMGGLMFGFDLGVVTGAIPFVQKQFDLNNFSLGFVVAIFEIGCMLGTLVAGGIADKIGRKKSLVIVALSFIITTIGIFLADSVVDFSTWRLLQGVGVGAASVLSPLYIAEVSPAADRGKLVSMNQLTIILGIFLASVVSYYYGRGGELSSWRWMFGFALVPSMLFLLLVFFLPETPRWLVKRGRNENAAFVLNRISRSGNVQSEIDSIKSSLQHFSEGKYRDLVSKKVFPVLLVAVSIAVLQQLCGSNNITPYMQIIFEQANIRLDEGLFNAVLVSGVFLIFTVFSMLLIDRVGRRKLMLLGFALMGFFLLALAFLFMQDTVQSTLILISLGGFIAVYAFTLGPVTWVLLSELFPNTVRSKALSVSAAALWLACFVVVLVSPYLMSLDISVNFFIFACFNLIGFFFTKLYVPETKGKTLEQISQAFTNKEPALVR